MAKSQKAKRLNDDIKAKLVSFEMLLLLPLTLLVLVPPLVLQSLFCGE